jgi:hypothetical protein
MTSATQSLTHWLDAIGAQLDREETVTARMQFVDGRNVEVEILDVGDVGLTVRDPPGAILEIPSQELPALDVRSPRRVREWLLAFVAIPAVTAILVAFAQIPGFNPKRGDVVIGFVLVMGSAWGLGRIGSLRRGMRDLLSRWDRVYSSAETR